MKFNGRTFDWLVQRRFLFCFLYLRKEPTKEKLTSGGKTFLWPDHRQGRKTEVIEGGREMFRSLRLGKKGRKGKHGKTILKL